MGNSSATVFKTDLCNLAINIIPYVSLMIMIYKSIFCRRKKNKKPPFAPAGTLKTIQTLGGPNVPWFFLEMAKRTNSDIFRLRLPRFREVYCVGCHITTREIFLDKETNKPMKIYSRFDQISGYRSIFSRNDGTEWHSIRKGLIHAFSSREIQRMERIFSRHVDKWIENTLDICVNDQKTFDPSLEMKRLTFNIILDSLFEYRDLSNEEFYSISNHIDAGLREFTFKHNMNPLRKFYGPLLSKYNNALMSCRQVQAFAENLLNSYRNKKDKSENITLIRIIAEHKSLVCDKERIAEIVTTLIAAHDTTGQTLSTTLVLLAKHPTILAKLRRELLTMDASKRSTSKYLRNVIMESQRLLPVVARGSIRVTGRDFICKGGSMIIPKGSICFMPRILVHRNPKVFQDPECFCPERWETADKEMYESYTPFALGRRNCLGQAFARAELYSVFARLLANYTFEVETEGKFDYFLTLKYDGVRLKPSRVQ